MPNKSSQNNRPPGVSTRRPRHRTTISLPEAKWLPLLVVPAMIQPWIKWPDPLGSSGAVLNVLMSGFGMSVHLYAMWLIGRVHQIMAQSTRNRYEIRPVKAVLRHLWPIYSIWWCAHWTSLLADRLRAQRGGQLLSRNTLLWAFVLAQILYRGSSFAGRAGLAVASQVLVTLAPPCYLVFVMILRALVTQNVTFVSPDEYPDIHATTVPSNWGWRVYLALDIGSMVLIGLVLLLWGPNL